MQNPPHGRVLSIAAILRDAPRRVVARQEILDAGWNPEMLVNLNDPDAYRSAVQRLGELEMPA